MNGSWLGGGWTGGDAALDENDRFLYDATARYNETVLQNVDSLENGLLAIAAGVIAVAVFAADKIAELHPLERGLGLGLLAGSAMICFFGYVRRPKDTGSRMRFFVDYAFDPVSATFEATKSCARISDQNAALRSWKRRAAIVAAALLFVSALLIIFGRAYGAMI